MYHVSMKESFENPSAIPPTETGEESSVLEQPDESVSTPESIEAESHTIEDIPQERVEALEEGIRLTEIGRDTALADLERWRNNNTTEPSHFEFRLPEIQNRISRAEHSISSSRLDIDIINSGAESPEQEDEVVKGFIADQVMDQRTAGLRNQLSSFDMQEADFNERIERNNRATEKLQAELDDLNTSIESGDPDSDRLKLHRRDVLVEMNSVTDRYETLMQEKEGIDALAQSRESVQSEIDAVVAAGVSEEELPKSLKEDPDYAACLKEADTYGSDDDREFKRNIKYDPGKTAEKLFRDRFPQKSAYYDRMIPAEVETAESKTILETEGSIESPIEVTKAETIRTIREQMNEGKINKEPDYERLKGEPIIDTKTLYDVEPSRAEQSTFEFVETDKIVGRPNADNYENGWAHEYDERGGRISEIVQQVNNPEDETGIERIFHTEDGTNERIKLASYEGPAGPIYSVFDGTHRVAGIKASGLEKMPAEIFKTEYPYEKTTADSEEVADWQDKIDRGFIVGSIETIETDDGERSLLKVESEVLPWIRARNQNDVFKLNQAYEQQYPGALEQVGFPKETLTDRTAFWAYMDGNFDQWKQLQEEDDLEDSEDSVEEIKPPKSVTTAKGSVYTYLDDGRTQRFKSVEGEMKEPQNVLTFIPRIDSIGDWEHFERLPDWIKENDNDQVMEILASDYIHNPNKRVVLTNESNEIVRSNADATKAKSLLLQFVDNATNQTEFALPVSSKPEIGATTYDARYFDKDGKEHMSAHIGNAVTSIEY